MQLKLANGGFTLIDDEDFEKIKAFNWRMGASGYAIATRRENGKFVVYWLHKVITNTPSGSQCDHKSRDKLDNRKQNLRPATSHQNLGNRIKRKDSRTNFKGVTWHKKSKKWWARIGLAPNGNKISLGLFGSEEAAAQAYNNAAKNYFGEFALLNAVC